MSIDTARARRGRLDQEAVLQAAELVVDRDGYDDLTMTSLATYLDARVSSLYNHVTNLEDLRAQIQIRAMRMLGTHVRAAAMGHAGVDGLHALSQALRSFARSHPQRYAALTRPPIDREGFYAAALEAIEALAIMARSAGLSDDRLIHNAMAMFACLHGFVSLEVAGYFGDLSGTSADAVDLDEVYEQIIEGAVTAASLKAHR
ncbi:MAG: WHG domain-containing protein [Nocardioidaceae bacterium]|nr:WHG domain-containing protein [Nocardioidaceae bacterium]